MKSFKVYEILTLIKAGSTIEDRLFDQSLYGDDFKVISPIHWSPIDIIIKSVEFLENIPNVAPVSILDIGSGIGKFCTVASLVSSASYVGVEIRENLFCKANEIKNKFRLPRIEFINSSFCDIDFEEFGGYYFFNSFAENFYVKNSIDRSIPLSSENYRQLYCQLRKKLSGCSPGKKLVTYCTSRKLVPENFILVQESENGKLIFWESQ